MCRKAQDILFRPLHKSPIIANCGIGRRLEPMVEVPLSESQYDEASRRLRAAGINISGPTGTLSREGITAKYSYANGLLTIEVVDKPFFLPLSLIESQMRGYIEKGLAELNRPA